MVEDVCQHCVLDAFETCKMDGSGYVINCDSENDAMNPHEASSKNSGTADRISGQPRCTLEELTEDNATRRDTTGSLTSRSASFADCPSRSQLSSSGTSRVFNHWDHEKYNHTVCEKNSMRYDAVECCADDSGNDDDIDTADCSDDDVSNRGSLVVCELVEDASHKKTVSREAEIVSISSDSSSVEAWKQPECDEFCCDFRESIDKIRDRNSRFYDESYEVTESGDHVTCDPRDKNRDENSRLFFDDSYDVVNSTDNEDIENGSDSDSENPSGVGDSKSSHTSDKHLFKLCSKRMSSFEPKTCCSASSVGQREYHLQPSDATRKLLSEWSAASRITPESGPLSENAGHFDEFGTRSQPQPHTNLSHNSEIHYRAEGTASSLELGAARSHVRPSHVASSDGSTWNGSRRKNFADGLDSAGNSPKDDDDDDSDDEVDSTRSEFMCRKDVKSGSKGDLAFKHGYAKDFNFPVKDSNGVYHIGGHLGGEMGAASVGRTMYPRYSDSHLERTMESENNFLTEPKTLGSQKDEQRLRMMRRRRERRENAAAAGLSQSNAVEGYVGDKELSVDELVSYIDAQAANDSEKQHKTLSGRRKSKKKKKSGGEKVLIGDLKVEPHFPTDKTLKLRRTKGDSMMNEQDVCSGKSEAPVDDPNTGDFGEGHQPSIGISSGKPIKVVSHIDLIAGTESCPFESDQMPSPSAHVVVLTQSFDCQDKLFSNESLSGNRAILCGQIGMTVSNFDGAIEAVGKHLLSDKDDLTLKVEASASSISDKNSVVNKPFETLASSTTRIENSESQELNKSVVNEYQKLDVSQNALDKHSLLSGDRLQRSNLAGASTPTSSVSDARDSLDLDLDFRAFADDYSFPVDFNSVVDNLPDDHNFTIVQKKKRKPAGASCQRDPVSATRLSQQKASSPQENLTTTAIRRTGLVLKPGVLNSSSSARSILSSEREATGKSVDEMKPAKLSSVSESLVHVGTARALANADHIDCGMTPTGAIVVQCRESIVMSASNDDLMPDIEPKLSSDPAPQHPCAGVAAVKSKDATNGRKTDGTVDFVGTTMKPAQHLPENCIAVSGLLSLKCELRCDDDKHVIADKKAINALVNSETCRIAEHSTNRGVSAVEKCTVMPKKVASSHAFGNRSSFFLDTRQPFFLLGRDAPKILFGFDENVDRLSLTDVTVPSSCEAENVSSRHEATNKPEPAAPIADGEGISPEIPCIDLDVGNCCGNSSKVSEVSSNPPFVPKDHGFSFVFISTEADGHLSEVDVTKAAVNSLASGSTVESKVGPILSRSSDVRHNLYSTQMFLFQAFEETLLVKHRVRVIFEQLHRVKSYRIGCVGSGLGW